MRSLLGRFHRPFARSAEEQLLLLNDLGDGSTLSLDFTTGVLDPRLTFTRDGGGTYIGNDGLIYGMDLATSGSLAIGTGSKSVTLTATAGVDRRYIVGQTVWISNGANNMRGPVTAYNASTQVLTINATATSGSGSFTSWTVGNASARFDYDPTAIGTARGLLIESSATNLLSRSEEFNNTGSWSAFNRTVTPNDGVAPDGNTTADSIQATVSGDGGVFHTTACPSGTHTFSVFAKANGANGFTISVDTSSNGRAVDFTLTGGGSAGTPYVRGTGGNVTSLTASVQTFQNGWVRCIVTVVTTGTNSIALYTKSGTSKWLAWGAQLEAGGASSYIPTGASQGSRAADSLVIQDGTWRNTANIDSTWYVDGALNKMNTAFNSVFDVVGNVGFTERNRVFISATGSQVRFTHFARSASVNPDFEYAINQASPNGYVYGSRFKVAATFDNTAGENRSSWNGATSNSTTAAACTTTTTYFTITVGSGNDWHFRSIKYWPLSLPQTTLNGITTL